MTFVTTRHSETTGGALRLVLESERPPTAAELNDLERFELVWAVHHSAGPDRPSDAVVDEMDAAIWAFGGEQEITAG